MPNINNLVDVPQNVPSEPRQSFVEKIHGITDKIQSFGHGLGHDSSSEMKSKTGAKYIYGCLECTKLYNVI